MVALTLFYTSQASSITNAAAAGSASGGTQGNGTLSLSRPTAGTYLEMRKATGLALSSTLPATASTYGQVLDSTLLEGKTLTAGTWTGTFSFKYTGVAVTGRPWIQVFKRSGAGTYTSLGSGNAGADVTLTTSYVAKTITFSIATDTLFTTGDKLYFELYFVNSARPSTGTDSIEWYLATTTTGVTTAQLVTPGYTTTPVTSSRSITGISAAVKALDRTHPAVSVSASVSVSMTTSTRSCTSVSASVVGTPVAYTASPGDNLTTKVNAMHPGDTLTLANGTYTSPFNLSNRHGATTAPLLIKAANDGQAIIDGSGTAIPLFVQDSTDLVFEGLHVQNSSASVVWLYGDVSGNWNITLRRCEGTGAGPGNHQVYAATEGGAGILFEDCIGWGRGRYIFQSYHMTGTTFRRCFAYQPWQHQADFADAPRVGFGVYATQNILLENCISRNVIPFEADYNYYSAQWCDNDDPTITEPNENVTYKGCIWHECSAGVVYANTTNSDSTHTYENIFMYLPYSSAAATYNGARYNGDAFEWGNAAPGGSMNRFTMVGGQNVMNIFPTGNTLSLKNSVFLNNSGACYPNYAPATHTYNDYSGNGSIGLTIGGTERTTAPTYDTATYGKGAYLRAPSNLKGLGESGGDIGCEILYRYQDGTITTTPLWPWPMEARIAANLGISVTYESGGGLWKTLSGAYGGGARTITGISAAVQALGVGRPISGVSAAVGTASAYEQAVLTDTPLRYYRLGESSGLTAIDSGSQAQDGTLHGSITPAQTGLIAGDSDTAMLFDGSSGYISFPTTGLPTGAAAMSLECWVELASVPGGGVYGDSLGIGSNVTKEDWALYYGDPSGNLSAATRGTQIGSGYPITINTPYHCVLTFDGTTAIFYVNGVQQGASTAISSMNLTYGVAYAGQDPGTGSFFNGTIDEVAIYDAALTLTQVAAHYAAGTGASGPITRPIVGVEASVQALGIPRTITGMSVATQALGITRPIVSVSGATQALGLLRPVSGVSTSLVFTGTRPIAGVSSALLASQIARPVASVSTSPLLFTGARLISGVSSATKALGVERGVISVSGSIGAGGISRTIIGVSAAVQAFGVARSVVGVSAATLQPGVGRTISTVSTAVSASYSRSISGVSAATLQPGIARPITSVSAATLQPGITRPITSVSSATQALGLTRPIVAVSTSLVFTGSRPITGVSTSPLLFTGARSLTSVSAATQAFGVTRPIISVSAAIGVGGVTRTITGVSVAIKALGVIRDLSGISGATIQVGITRPLSPISASVSLTRTRTITGVSSATKALGVERPLVTVSAATKAFGVTRPLSGITGAIGQGGITRTISGVSVAVQAIGIPRNATSVSSALQAIGITRAVVGISAATKQLGLVRNISGVSVALAQTVSLTLTPISSAVQATVSRSFSGISSSLTLRSTRPLTDISSAVMALGVARPITGILGAIGVAGITKTVTGVSASVFFSGKFYTYVTVVGVRGNITTEGARGNITVEGSRGNIIVQED